MSAHDLESGDQAQGSADTDQAAKGLRGQDSHGQQALYSACANARGTL